MALSHALLASLGKTPASGYDLARRFGSSLGYFWKASHQQIYKELAKLSEQGFLDVRLEQQSKRPNRKIYTLTPLGESHLRDWLQQEVQPAESRDELLVKIYAGQWTHPSQLINELQAHRHKHQQKLALYQSIAQSYFAAEELDYSQTCMRLTLDYGLSYEKNWLNWCDQALQALAHFA